MAVSSKRRSPHRKPSRKPATELMPETGLFDKPEIITKIKGALTKGEILYLLNKIEQDQKRCSREAQVECIERIWAITFRVLNDRFGFGRKRLMRFWDGVTDYSRALNNPKDPLKVKDIIASLKEENDFEIDWTGC